MKGLLLKDFYLAIRHCRTYALICAVFIGVSVIGKENLFLVFYPCMLGGMVSTMLLGYDERSGWMQYAQTLPYTRAQLVSAKYLFGLGVQGVILLLTAVAQAVRMYMNGGFQAAEYARLLMIVASVSMMAGSISMPFMFKNGVEKGRLSYYLMIGFVCAVSGFGAQQMEAPVVSFGTLTAVLPVGMLAGSAVVYAAAWLVSIRFFEKRENI